MDYPQTLQWLYDLERKGWILGLERVKEALENITLILKIVL